MKILALTLVLLQLADYCAANCVAPWQDRGGQCMVCNSELGQGNTNYAAAQASCEMNGGDLATIVNPLQHADAMTCGADTWMGFVGAPNPHFQDGTRTTVPAVNLPGVVVELPTAVNCYYINNPTNWVQPGDCNGDRPFTCSKPYMTCPDLEDVGFASLVYANPNNPPNPPAGAQSVATTATYTCPAGFMVSGGNNPRTCQPDGTWSGSRPMCVHEGVCPALVEPDYAGVMYSTSLHANGMYIYGTAAVQMCDEHYEKESGTTIRVCMPGGMWSGTPIWCEKEKNELAIGLGVGLGLLLLIVIIICCIVCCCSRRRALHPVVVPRPYHGPHAHHHQNPYPMRY